ncbi:MAG: hypothetical protein KAU58_00105 [Candidatus Omnitrophica bacterium]|nr:hypothetical protein [Candidatus Omnitrophota bacterium]
MQIDDNTLYQEQQHKKWLEYENTCNRCGACCGIKDNDPCEHLKRAQDNRYFCDIYENRFGLRKTVSGKEIMCVPIRNMLHKTWWGRTECAYLNPSWKP